MSLGEFFTKTIMNSYVNQLLSIAALGAIGACVEYCREKDDELKSGSAKCGLLTYSSIGALGVVVYSSYRDFNIYAAGITALCAVLNAYSLSSKTTEMIEEDGPEELMSVNQSVITGLGIGAMLGFIACKIGESVLSK